MGGVLVDDEGAKAGEEIIGCHDKIASRPVLADSIDATARFIRK
jgi:hypothetical protein